MNDTLRIIKTRRSVRKFKEEQIRDEEINEILEAGLYAPSAHNHQPWNFTVIQNKDLLEELNIISKEMAKKHPDKLIQKMANNHSLNIFYDAPTVIVVSGKDQALMPLIDCVAATENLLIAAESLDIGSCWIGFLSFLFNSEKAEEYKKKLNIPAGYTPYHAISLGYKDIRIAKALPRKENAVQFIR